MDIVDFLLKTMGDILKWIIKVIFKIIVALVKAIYNAIFGNKEKGEQAQFVQEQEAGSGSEDGPKYKYDNIMADINDAPNSYQGDALKERLQFLFYNIYLNPFCTIEERLSLLERIGKVVEAFYGDDIENRVAFYHDCIKNTTTLLAHELGEPAATLVNKVYQDMLDDINSGNMKRLGNYLGTLLSYAGLINSDSVTLTKEMVEKYDLPHWFEYPES